MKITLPMDSGITLEFASFEELAKYYGQLADTYRTISVRQTAVKNARYNEGRAASYDIICWQIGRMKIEA